MAAGDRVTSFDIAALAKVSQPTVSRALRGDRTVSDATRKRVEAVAQLLGYKVDRAASSLRSGHSNTLALLFFEDPLPDGSFINPFFLSMLGSILMTCAHRKYDLLTSFQQLSSDWHVDFEDSRKADGLILLGYGDYAIYRTRLDQLARQGTHYVRWGAAETSIGDTVIGCDNTAGGRQAARRLAARGCRRIAFLGDASDHYPEFRDRYLGLCAGLAEAGLTVDPRLQADCLSVEPAGYGATQRLIAAGAPFDGLFAASDLIALGALRALAEAGRRVPGDVAVIGFDDIPAAALGYPPLTTVAQDYGSAGPLLVDALIRRVNGEAPENRVLTPHLVVRASA
ncbi:substrate-binding domain-containing protein (plasmid) [Polymorphobacter sp. PAMC 29334]|uniref:LacI family DNA-binding transcriptional regulator n=1 Tax=Polymorphobacter sp. PAMC 29334 TaxID=2862331 RepID=UPI001C74513B|nr:substrate-binding domain-containing protein [Polymorphobacter sp. PAMC 29334]QYE37091.1 substrate-binding domain-containing protein [Polymorphobacter sp. PAMC 29334]